MPPLVSFIISNRVSAHTDRQDDGQTGSSASGENQGAKEPWILGVLGGLSRLVHPPELPTRSRSRPVTHPPSSRPGPQTRVQREKEGHFSEAARGTWLSGGRRGREPGTDSRAQNSAGAEAALRPCRPTPGHGARTGQAHVHLLGTLWAGGPREGDGPTPGSVPATQMGSETWPARGSPPDDHVPG